MGIIILSVIFIAIVLISYHLLMKNNKKLKRLRKEWETGNFQTLDEPIQSVSSYWANKKNSQSNYDGVDQLTWDDLAMDEVFQKLNYTQSTVGSEYLFNQLRDINPSLAQVQNNEELYTLLATNQELREELLLILSGLGKRNYTNSSSFFFEEQSEKIKHASIYILLAILPILSIFLLFYSVKYGLVILFGSFLVNTIIYYRNKSMLANDLLSVSYVAVIIQAAKSLASVNHSEISTYTNEFKEKVRPLKKILALTKIVAFGKDGGGEFDFLFEYIRILFLLDFISYNKIIKTVANHKEKYREIWERIGELDAAIAVAFYRKSLDTYCTPIFSDQEEITFEKMAHPLIDKPVTNTSTLGKSTLITGSNASGKSTYIKAIAINAISAQTIHTVLAEKWTMKPSFIATSMAIQDNVLDGDSYFIAEIKSLQRITRLIEEGKPCISFIDEILKGTNTIERIAASAAMMEWLSMNKGINVIASHDIELTEIARHSYTNYHFRESIEDGEIRFDYTVHSGPSTTKNAIRLLEMLGYPTSITEKANGLAQHFTERREWEVIRKNR
ncbi:MutS-related protein [Sporosarcina sp. FSL K6-3457]|uniref:MutS-related protein n=1 Tax=Sporosarcina sp. FSL K6-3457 TaxID=2978204 RepID=UPI0030F543B5